MKFGYNNNLRYSVALPAAKMNSVVHAALPQERRTSAALLESDLGLIRYPLSTNGDQDQFSPNDIHTLSRDKVLRINEMITKKKKCFDLLSNSLNFLFKEIYRDQLN